MTPSPQVSIPLSFVNKVQEEFFYCNKRNEGFSGGYGNGKTMGGSMKALYLLATFPKYRVAGTRYTSKDLVTSTMSTFFKVCPPELYADAYGGRRADRDGYLRLVNNSEVFWLHLDDHSEETLRGLEVNSRLGDQDEEIAENMYITMDSRIERWDQAEIPAHLNRELFLPNPYTGRPMPPCYNMSLVNPDTTLHWFWRRFHPDSPEAAANLDTHAFFSASTHDNPAIPESLKAAMRSRDAAWVDRFYWGKWGISGGAIHYVPKECILEYVPDSILSKPRSGHTTPITGTDLAKLLEVIKRDGIKYRVMDHGDAAPTTCLWFAYLSPSTLNRNYGVISKGIHICYREYYMPERLVSYHREAIASLSGDEKYYGNYADPAIFKKNQQKYGGSWTTADEYLDRRLKAPPIMWTPADNNEMATRNAVGEMLVLDPSVVHPITGGVGPAMYFLRKDQEHNLHGCSHVITQTQSARHKKIGSVNGQDVYSDERDPNVTDHAYDPLRYYSIMPKTNELPDAPTIVPQFSFAAHLGRRRMNKYAKGGYGR